VLQLHARVKLNLLATVTANFAHITLNSHQQKTLSKVIPGLGAKILWKLIASIGQQEHATIMVITARVSMMSLLIDVIAADLQDWRQWAVDAELYPMGRPRS
jgi:hypothetical protein